MITFFMEVQLNLNKIKTLLPLIKYETKSLTPVCQTTG